MSRRWEEAIEEWYSKSDTSNLEDLDLVETKPSTKELAHNLSDNLSVVYDRVCLSCRDHLKNFKTILEELEFLKKENQKTNKALVNLIKESYRDAVQATEEIEAPAIGFCRPAEYKEPTSSSGALLKQGNTQIQLLVQIQEKLLHIEERIAKLEAKKLTTTLPKEVIKEYDFQRRSHHEGKETYWYS
ncbi:hypothetical protein ZIOFF_018473 [Zingiber officinale]|uniref:Uncharacterized protein n=1 Tax=Zingiber officinale TaxID=94328 RepID=A0A8J5HQD6_ZINOF|nr:hypothetical protein ZIOFF_018473 [Zingiber officinale]